jgi:hypothetical protein
LNDYYSGAAGARRLLTELDWFLQHLVDDIGPTEWLTCAIELELSGGEVVALNKVYRPLHSEVDESEPAQRRNSPLT